MRSTPPLSKSSRSVQSRLLGALPRLCRGAVLVVVAWLLHVAAIQPKPPEDIPLSAAKAFFPEADHFAGGDPQWGGQTVQDQEGHTLGLLLTTSPHTDDLVGYTGPSNLLIALDPQQQVIGVRLLSSGDTQAHVDDIKSNDTFWKQFIGLHPSARPPKVEGVSGSTLTSLAMAEAIQRRLNGSVVSLRFPEPVSLSEVQSLFPDAHHFLADDSRRGWLKVVGKKEDTLGFAVRTSPQTDNGHGYRGPTESLVGVSADGQTVVGFVIRRSYDTPDYVDRVRTDEEFRRLLSGRSLHDWAHIDFSREGIEGVSGATQTSFAVADGIRRRFVFEEAQAQSTSAPRRWSPGLLAILVGGLAMAFSPLRTYRPARWVWQAVLVVAFLVWIGDLLSLALVVGWARHGIPWQTAPSVVLLVAVALLIPWTTQRQIYCQQLCPHGAAQTWLGQFKRLHLRIPSNLQRWLLRLPGALLVASVLLGIFYRSFDLATLEPFDGWALKGAALISAILAIAGLVASLFVPQAYCRYGCPTGELLKFVKRTGSRDQVATRDWIAGSLVLISMALLLGPKLLQSSSTPLSKSNKPLATKPAESSSAEISGKAFGTTWSLKVRGQHDLILLAPTIATELDRIESTLSHWRPNSYTAQFNASETTLETEQPAELIKLVSHAKQLSEISDGRYDITIAPLVDAWGSGPSGQKMSPPTDEQIAQLLSRVGWQKLIVDPDQNTLRKTDPQLQIDLGSLLQGYAADQVAKLLDDAGIKEYLIDVGGELLAKGAWSVAIENPRDPSRPLQTLTLQDRALATSGIYRSKQQLGETTAHHLISPKTGRPVPATTILAAVVAPTALEADAWATVMLAVGLPDASTLADQQSLPVLLVDPDYQIHLSPLARQQHLAK